MGAGEGRGSAPGPRQGPRALGTRYWFFRAAASAHSGNVKVDCASRENQRGGLDGRVPPAGRGAEPRILGATHHD